MQGVSLIHLFRTFNNLSLRKKINLINLVAITAGVLFTTVCLHRMILAQAEDRAIGSSLQEVELVSNTIGTLMNSMENFSKLAIINQTSQSLLAQDNGAEPTRLDKLDNLNLIYASLNTLVNSSPFIDSVIIQSASGHIYASSNLSTITNEELGVYPTGRILQANGSPVWVETFQSPYLSDGMHKMMLAVGRKITNMEDGTLMGFLYINIEERKISELYGGKKEGGSIIVANKNGTIISNSDPHLLNQSISNTGYWPAVKNRGSGYEMYREGDRDQLVAFKKLDNPGWSVINIVPTSNLIQDQWKITWFNIGFGAAALLMSFCLSAFFSNRITKPLIRLSQAMTAVGDGNMDIRTQVRSQDEVGRLAFKFNEMVVRVRELLHKVNQEEKQKRMLELGLLYSQIKPHFLYNTLEMVRAMTLMIGARDIANTVKALGDFYRMSLNNGGELTSVAQERKHLESYLFIQQKRYGHLHYRIDFDERMAFCRVPKLLLQPLVENAVCHGLLEKTEGALCEITGRIEEGEDGGVICFVVKDNGKGMSAEQLNRIWSMGQAHSHDLSHFGIRNVQERIILRYGNPYGITIHSVEGAGVEVTVRLPLQCDRDE